MRQDRKNSHTGTGQICAELRNKKREDLPHFKRKKRWEALIWDKQRVSVDKRSDAIQEGNNKGNSDSWMLNEYLRVQKEKGFNGAGETRCLRHIVETGHQGYQGRQHSALLQRSGQTGRAEDWM